MSAELSFESFGHAKDSAERADVFANQKHFGVCEHRFTESEVNCLGEWKILNRHDQTSSSNEASYAASHARCSSITGCGSE